MSCNVIYNKMRVYSEKTQCYGGVDICDIKRCYTYTGFTKGCYTYTGFMKGCYTYTGFKKGRCCKLSYFSDKQ